MGSRELSVKIQITVKTNSRHESVKKMPDGTYHVAVNAPPVEGKANDAVIRILAEHFSAAKSSINILKGVSGKRKIVEINQF